MAADRYTSHVRVVVRSDELRALEADWWRLYRRCPTSTPFQSPAWLMAWWQAFSPGELHVVTVRRAGELVAMAPGYIEVLQQRRMLPLGMSLSDYLDVLIDPQHERFALSMLHTHFHETCDSWDEWEWPELRPEAMAHRLRCPAACSEQQHLSAVCPTLSLPANGILQNSVPRHCLRNLHGDWKRLQRAGHACVVEAAPRQANDYFELLAGYISERLQAQGQAHYMNDARVRHFHRAVMPSLMQAGLLKLYVLLLNRQVIAIHYLLQDRSNAYSYLTGFDQAHRAVSPGTVLLGHVIEQSLARGAREFHFLRGSERYKYYWGASDRVNVRRVFRPAVRQSKRHTDSTSIEEQHS